MPECRLEKELSPEAIAAHREANAIFRSLQDHGFASA
jgi:hypothetical protein